jgi:hypothetical protein
VTVKRRFIKDGAAIEVIPNTRTRPKEPTMPPEMLGVPLVVVVLLLPQQLPAADGMPQHQLKALPMIHGQFPLATLLKAETPRAQLPEMMKVARRRGLKTRRKTTR